MAEKLNWFDKTKIFFGEVRAEMSKVVWPTQEQVQMYTVVVVISTAIVSVVMGMWDMVLAQAVNVLFGIRS